MRELRRSVTPRTPFAAESRDAGGSVPPRHPVARGIVAAARVVAALVVALAGAAAGLVFVVLLPICGIASIAEGFAQASWGAARSLVRWRHRGALSQH